MDKKFQYSILVIIIVIIIIFAIPFTRNKISGWFSSFGSLTPLQKLILDNYNKVLGREPVNEDISAYEEKVSEKTGKENLYYRRNLKETFENITDATKSQEFVFWENVLKEGIISVSDFENILRNSEERKKIILDKITEIAPNTLTASEKEQVYNEVNDKLSLDEDEKEETTKILKTAMEKTTYKYTSGLIREYKNLLGKNPTREELDGMIAWMISANTNAPSFGVNFIPEIYSLRFNNLLNISDGIKIPEGKLVMDYINIDPDLRDPRKSMPSFRETDFYKNAEAKRFFNSILFRNPSSDEIISFARNVIDPQEKISPTLAKKYITSLVDGDIETIIKNEISKTYMNYMFSIPSNETIEKIYSLMENGKLLRENLLNYLKKNMSVTDREKALKDTIIKAYKNAIGKEPSNAFLDYWVKVIENKTNITLSDILDYNNLDIFYIASANMGDCVAFFKKKTIDCYDIKTKKIISTTRYQDFYPDITGGPSLINQKNLVSATQDPRDSNKIWFFLNGDIVLTLWRDEEKVNLISVYESNLVGDMFSEKKITVSDIAGIMPHYLDNRPNEIMVFLKNGRYFVWDIIKNYSRYDKPITDSKVSFPNFPITLDKIEDAFIYDKDKKYIGFITNKNEILVWDPVNGVQIN